MSASPQPDIRQARIAAGLTQEALARQADVSVATVTRADRGQLPRRSTVRTRLLRTLGLLPEAEQTRSPARRQTQNAPGASDLRPA